MTDADDTPSELTKVQTWRVHELTRLGMTELHAVVLGMRGPNEWAQARKLIEDGCPPHLAFDIVR